MPPASTQPMKESSSTSRVLLSPQDIPADIRLGITAEGSVSLTRTVEMLQWKEMSREVERTGSDGKTSKSKVYDYEKTWSSKPIDSSRFKTASAPKNPPMPLSGETFDIGEAKVGAFRLSGNDVAPLGNFAPMPLTDDSIAKVAGVFGSGKPVWLIDNQFVTGGDPEKPEIGDLRIGYSRGDLDTLSAVGGQKGDRLSRYIASNGREIFLIRKGAASAEEMFKGAIAGNNALTWGLRVLGLILMFIGFSLTFKLLSGTVGQIPVIGSLIRAGTALVSVAMTLALGSLVIAAGWIFYRPLTALAIAAIGLGVAFAMGLWGKKKAGQQTTAARS